MRTVSSTRFLLTAGLAGLSTLAACSEDPEEPAAVFSTAEPAALERGVRAGLGQDAAGALLLGWFIGNGQIDGDCPRITTSGSTLTATGGCTVIDEGEEIRVDGSVVIENYQALRSEELPAGVIVSIDFRDLRWSNGEERSAIDGVVSFDSDARIEGDLRVTYDGLTSTSRVTLQCDEAPLDDQCAHAEPGWIAVDGLGGATVTGVAGLGTVEGELILEGAETLVVALDGTIACDRYTIDGEAAGELCFEATE